MNEKVLFIRLRLLGDIVFTIPAVQLYKKKYPDSETYYAAEQRFREAAEIIPGIDKVISLPDRMSWREMARFGRLMRQENFQTVIDFHSGPRSALLTFLSGAKIRVGYRTPNRNWAYNRLVPRKTGSTPSHSVYSQARLLIPLGIEVKEIPPYPGITIQEEQVSDHVRKAVEADKKIVIHIGAKKRYRDWGIKKFASLIEILTEEKFSVFLIGKGETEENRAKVLKDRFGLHDFTGSLSIREIIFLISRSDVYFGADSGPLHLASLTRTPIVALYGPNIPEISGPHRQEKVKVIQKKLDCIPCPQKSCKFEEVKCMEGIGVEQVHQAIKKLMRS
jgi:lipopolysaccharide heptosyltransferase II